MTNLRRERDEAIERRREAEYILDGERSCSHPFLLERFGTWDPGIVDACIDDLFDILALIEARASAVLDYKPVWGELNGRSKARREACESIAAMARQAIGGETP